MNTYPIYKCRYRIKYRCGGLFSGLILAVLLTATAVFADVYNPQKQQQLLDAQLAALNKGSSGIRDLFFLGIAPYSTEDVFMNETRYVRDLFDSQYNTLGRSLFLVNNNKTLDEYPVMTVANLRVVLNKIGSLMNREDALVLFITSHGDKGRGIRLKAEGIENLTMPGKYLDAETLRVMLDKNGIHWRIIILSACYSGGMIETLKNENSLIITSASRDNPSFGCGHHGNFTQFGESYFRDALNRDRDFISAFNAARERITELEETLDIESSNPQIHVGRNIRSYLDHLLSPVRQ